MKSKINAALIVIAAILLSALALIPLLAERQGYRNLLLVTPSSFGAPGQNPEKLEEFSDEEFPLTYEIKRTSTARAANSTHQVALVGTNQNHANIMGYVLLDGGFFTKTAWDAKNKHAVLNETAAFQIFGSNRISGLTLKLNGESWIITGVIQDNDAENANIFVPSSVTGGQAQSLMVLTDNRDISGAYVKNALKNIGIHENNYDFISLSKSASAFDERFSVAWKSALLVAVLLFIFMAGSRLLENLRFYRNRLGTIYFREMLVLHRADFVKTITGFMLFAAGIVAILLLSLEILETCLTWQEIIPITGELTAGDFGGRLVWLRDYHWIGVALFAVFIGVVLLYLLLFLLRKPRKENMPMKTRKVELPYGKAEPAWDE